MLFNLIVPINYMTFRRDNAKAIIIRELDSEHPCNMVHVKSAHTAAGMK